MPNTPTALELMTEAEKVHYQAWLKGVMTDDTVYGWREIKAEAEAAVWWAVGTFSISYPDVVRSWLVAAGEDIINGELH